MTIYLLSLDLLSFSEHCIFSSLFTAAGLELTSVGQDEEEQQEEDEEQEEDEIVLEKAVSRGGSFAVVPMEVVEERNRWKLITISTGVPLNLRYDCAHNKMSEEYWRKQEGSQRCKEDGQEDKGPVLKSEVALAPLDKRAFNQRLQHPGRHEQLGTGSGPNNTVAAWRKRRRSFPPPREVTAIPQRRSVVDIPVPQNGSPPRKKVASMVEIL